MKKNLLAVVIVLISFTAAAYPQASDQLNRLRIAQALEQAGEYSKAVGFYKELYDADPGNFVYFDGLRRMYMKLKEYDRAIALVRSKLPSDPKNISLYCELGDAYFKGGKEDSAMVVWDEALNVTPKNPGTYQAVASIMTQNSLFDKAIDVYKKGEKNTEYKSGFVIQIARLYFYSMNYKESVRELLRLFVSDNKAAAESYIESQLGSYSTSAQAVGEFTEEMKRQVADHSDNIYYRRILAFLYMEQKNYKAAYDTYKWLDEHAGSKGTELLAFAERAYNDEAYNVAANAYREVSNVSKAESIVSQSIMGYANSLRMLGEKDLTGDDRPCSVDDTLKDLNAAMAAYGDIIRDYPKTQFYAPAVLHSIEIKMNYFDDFKGAERLFSEFHEIPQDFSHKATLTRIELFMKEGRFQNALTASLRELAVGPADHKRGAPDGNYLGHIRYEAARSLYYMGDFDSASYYLKDVVSDPEGDAANEAIALSNLIENNKGMPEALKEYAAAEAMEVSGRIPEAALQLENIVKTYSQLPLAANASFDLAAAYCRMGKVNEALKTYASIAQDSTGLFADQAQFRIARIYQVTLHEKKKAVEEYENFLMRFPNSIYQNKVRDMLRDLLGNNS